MGGLCCNEPQIAFIGCFLIYLLAIYLTWKLELTKPMRLIAVFLHEMSHAIMCWVTGGEVTGIEVFENEGGVTKYRGGCQSLIIPAGYIGCSFWGMVFVVLSGGRITSTMAAGMFVLALLVSLFYSPNRFMVLLNIGYAIVTIVFIYIEWFKFSPILHYLILFYGVFVGIYSIFDIYDDLCKRTVIGSDAHAFYEIYPCCLPRCVGVQWAIWAMLFQILGVSLAIILMSDNCRDRSWFGCLRENNPF